MTEIELLVEIAATLRSIKLGIGVGLAMMALWMWCKR